MRTCSGLFSTDIISTPGGEFLAIKMDEYPYNAPTSRILLGAAFFTTSARIFPLTGPIDGMKERSPIASISRITMSAGSVDFIIRVPCQRNHLYLTTGPVGRHYFF